MNTEKKERLYSFLKNYFPETGFHFLKGFSNLYLVDLPGSF